MSSSYRDLRVWQQAMDLAMQVYRLTEAFPKHEMYGLTGQIGEQRSRSPATSLKEKDGGPIEISAAFFSVRVDRYWSWRRRFCWLGD